MELVYLPIYFFSVNVCKQTSPTVDGSEIRRSPVEVGSLFHYVQGFQKHPNGGFLAGFLNHQQYSIAVSVSLNRW